MSRLILRAIMMALLAATLAACGTRPRQTVDDTRMFDIRGVAVTANGGVPSGIITGVQRQMELAIAATVYAVPKIRAVANIHIADVGRDRTGRALADMMITISDVDSGQPVLVRGYRVLASSERGRVSDAAIVDAIAARLRYEFGLSMPAIRPVLRHDPSLSTRLKTRAERVEKPVRPIVIPLKTAPLVGADRDPMLNSKTKVEPVKKPAKVEPAVRKEEPAIGQQPAAANELESGARAKVVIKPKATPEKPADDEPCVETLETKC